MMRDYLVIIFTFYVTIHTVHSQWLDCPSGWKTSRTDTNWPCYLITNRIQRTWTEAQTFCAQMGGALWKIDSLKEKNWIYNLLNVYHGYYITHNDWWIGMHDNTAQTGLIWVDKSVPNMQLLQWVPGEPTSYDHSKACVQYHNGSLRHDSCQQRKYFVCERSRNDAVFCDARHGWESIKQNCYKVITKLRTWNDARGECQKENGDLMIVKDGSTQTVVYNFIESRGTDMWIGLKAFQSGTTYSFKWQSATGTNLDGINTFWSSHYHLTSTALQAVTRSNGSSACVTANHNLPSPNVWEPADCGKRAFSLCQKPQGRCASGWIHNSHRCYQVIAWKKVTWSQADAFCKREGARLLTIRFTSKQLFVNGLLANLKSRGVNNIWIGLSDNNQDSVMWYWSSGERISRISYTNFNGQTPVNRPGVRDCFNIYTDDKNGTWQIASDCSNNSSFICEIYSGNSPKLQPTTAPTITWGTDCGPFWVKDPATGYCYKFSDKAITWFQAQATCKSMGAQLASVTNYHEERFIADHIYGFTSPAVWIGINNMNSHEGYHWVDGTGFGYFNWAPGEPNNVGSSEHCGEMRPGGSNPGKWNDVSCISMKGYVCKKKSKDFPTSPAPTRPSVPSGKLYGCPNSAWTPFKNNCYMFMKTSTNWNNARQFCQLQKGELASIVDENEQNFVFSQLPVKTGYLDQLWLGLNDMDIQMRFEWTDNITVSYTNWAVNEPNNWQNRPEDCVTIFQQDGTWNDETCEDPKQGFVCKIPKAVLPSNTPQLHPASGCSSGYIGYGYNCFMVMSSTATWSTAGANCRARNSNLVVIKNRYQQAFLAAKISGSSGMYWTGLGHNGPNGSFQWVTGDNLAYTAWSANHTGNDNTSCIAMRSSGPGVGLWLDVSCTTRLKYICETMRSGFSTPLIVTTTTLTPPVCPPSWHDYNGYCYKVYNSNADKKIYFDARSACQGMGADLVSLHSAAEQSFVFSYDVTGYSYRTHSYWIGLNDFDVERGYKWSDGTAVNYTNWGKDEPNDYDGTDDCVEFNTGSKKWNDNTCYIVKAFVCKIKKGVTLHITTPTPPPTDPPECGSTPDWKLFNGSCYYVSTPNTGPNSRKSWFDAKDSCIQRGGDLASIHSLQETRFISTLISRTVMSDCWVGLSDLGVNQFGWTDGTPFDFTHWSGNEPNDEFGSEKCGQIHNYNGFWNDNNCNEKYHFVCKRPQGIFTGSTAIPTTPTVGGCPSGFDAVKHGNRCYKLFAVRDTAARMNYTDARDTCRNMSVGYDIASVTNHEEQASLIVLVNGMFLDKSGVWIGMNDLNDNSRFTWQDSSQLQYTNWDKNQPSSGGNCVEMYTDSRHAGKWHNINCGDIRAYVCQAYKDASIPVITPASGCTIKGYVASSMDCYKADPTPKSWADASASCQSDGTLLISVVTVFEQAYLDTLTASLNSPVWIGLSDRQATGTYTWQDGSVVIYTSWDKNEPTYTSTGSDRCVTAYNGFWNDTHCAGLYPYVCKKPFFAPFTPITPNPGGYCADITWKQFDHFCYYLNLRPLLSYSAAEKDCTSKGMQLASIGSKSEENFILQTVDADSTNSVNVWIGLRRKGGYFSWSDGSPNKYVNWETRPSGNDCVMMQYTDGTWQDASCYLRKGYICKVSKLPATIAPPTTTTVTTTTTTTTTPTTRSGGNTVSNNPGSVQTNQPTSSRNIARQSSISQRAGSYSTPKIPTPAALQKQNQLQIKADLSALQVAGIIGGMVLVLAAIGTSLLVIKRRSNGNLFSFQRFSGGDRGFDNATYDKSMDSVNINGHSGNQIHTQRNTNEKVTNGLGVTITDFSEYDA